MSFIREVGYTNDKTVDAFGRARTAELGALLESAFEYDLRPLRWVTSTAGSGTVTKATNISQANLTVTTTNGDLAVFQSRKYIRYQPGKSQLIYMSALIGAAKANVQSEVGYFDDNNGMFFRQANGMNVVTRTNTSGSVVDTAVAQASWNIDKMDGTGPSGVTLDFSKFQMFTIDFDWPEGRVRFGFNVAGALYYCHQIVTSNSIITPFMNTGSLPARARITNTGASGSGTTMSLASANVSSEGGISEVPGLPFSATNGITTINIINPTTRPILSIQVGATFAGLTNRGQTLLDLVSVTSAGGTCLVQIILNGTLTGSSFTAVDAANSSTLKDVAATAISGGTVIGQAYVSGNTDVTRGVTVLSGPTFFGSLDCLNNSFNGTTGDILSIVLSSFTGTNTATGIFLFYEVR
jgi:hypothetical protein